MGWLFAYAVGTIEPSSIREERIKFFEGKAAKLWIQAHVVFITGIPLIATGKMQNLKLRDQFHDCQLPVAQT